MIKKTTYAIVASFFIIMAFYIWQSLSPNIEERVINSNGYQIVQQSQEVELSFEFNPLWIPSRAGEMNKLYKLVYEGHDTKIYLDEIINLGDGQHTVVKLQVVPTFNKKGGAFVYPYIIGDSGSVTTIQFQPQFYDQSGRKLEWNIGKFSGPGNQFGFNISPKDYQNINHPIYVEYGKLNLITYEPTNN